MIRYLGIVNYLSDISHSDYIEKTYDNLKNKFNIAQKLDLFKTNHINLSNGFLNKSFNKDRYVIMYNGNIFNIKEIKKQLSNKGYKFSTKTNLKKEKIIPIQNIDNYLEAEILLTSYHEYKEKFLEHLNGTFSICIYDKTNNIVFLCIDRIGIETLYYTKNKTDNSFIFSTNIKDILNVPNMKAVLDKQGILELFGIGPIHNPGYTFFKDIYKLLPGHYAIYSNIGLVTHKYWDLKPKECNDNELQYINNMYSLIKKSTKIQTNDTERIGLLFSENINSGILIEVVSKIFPTVNTFSYNIIDTNKKNKSSNYINIFKKHYNIDNYNIISDTKVLYSLLIPAMMARDMPGMAYLDSTIFEFFSSVKNSGINKCISSLCSNEIFEVNDISTTGFPLCLSTNIRSNLINKNIGNEQILQEYFDIIYNSVIKDVIFLDNETEYDKTIRTNKYVNIKLYISSLVQRINHISSNINLEIMLPYLDYRIIEYIYNIPNHINTNNLLKKIFNKNFPNTTSILNTSSKMCNSNYTNMLEHEIKKILNDNSSKLLKVIDKNYVLQILNSKGSNLMINKNDELISYTQILAYLIQIEYWLNIYDIELEF
ncbi:MAG: asparagine synthetase B [Clostridia bacterium]|nr:asparagine synthetase B [Clostridia bacterium]MDD4386776.1 asparagine synthetase B [Clostridia bacterium]